LLHFLQDFPPPNTAKPAEKEDKEEESEDFEDHSELDDAEMGDDIEETVNGTPLVSLPSLFSFASFLLCQLYTIACAFSAFSFSVSAHPLHAVGVASERNQARGSRT